MFELGGKLLDANEVLVVISVLDISDVKLPNEKKINCDDEYLCVLSRHLNLIHFAILKFGQIVA